MSLQERKLMVRQNFMERWKISSGRNKGHLKNKGENALDIKGVSDKFQGRGGLSFATILR